MAWCAVNHDHRMHGSTKEGNLTQIMLSDSAPSKLRPKGKTEIDKGKALLI